MFYSWQVCCCFCWTWKKWQSSCKNSFYLFCIINKSSILHNRTACTVVFSSSEWNEKHEAYRNTYFAFEELGWFTSAGICKLFTGTTWFYSRCCMSFMLWKISLKLQKALTDTVLHHADMLGLICRCFVHEIPAHKPGVTVTSVFVAGVGYDTYSSSTVWWNTLTLFFSFKPKQEGYSMISYVPPLHIHTLMKWPGVFQNGVMFRPYARGIVPFCQLTV